MPQVRERHGIDFFPGGIGAEVGIYRRIPGKVVPTSIGSLPLVGGLAQQLLGPARALADSELWWPFPELGATIEFNFINPITREVIFSAGPQKGYWLTKWMDETSYPTFAQDHPAPAGYTDYILKYTINGKAYHHWPAEPGDLGHLAHAAAVLLLGDDPAPPPPVPPRPAISATSRMPPRCCCSPTTPRHDPSRGRPGLPGRPAPSPKEDERIMFDGVCQIRRAGVSPEGWAQLDLKDQAGSFDWTWYLSKPEISREVLATALVAVSTDKLLSIQIEDPVQSWARVIRCLVQTY